MYQTGICDTSDCDPVLAQAIRGLTWQQSSDKVAADPTLHSFCPHADLRSAAKAGTRRVHAQADEQFWCVELLREPALQARRRMHASESALLLGKFRPDAAPRVPAMRRKLKQMEAQGDYVPDEDDAAHAAPVSNASKSKR
jgi:hypothetical protein